MNYKNETTIFQSKYALYFIQELKISSFKKSNIFFIKNGIENSVKLTDLSFLEYTMYFAENN